MELHNSDRPTSVVSVSFVLFQGSTELVDLQRLANVKVDLMSKKLGHPCRRVTVRSTNKGGSGSTSIVELE